jgi:hypothetical protein
MGKEQTSKKRQVNEEKEKRNIFLLYLKIQITAERQH